MNWPNESKEYRVARDELLQTEIALRRQEEAVAAQRRALPLGGEVTQDYVFDGVDGPVRMSELFGDKDTLYLYNFMYRPGEQGLALEVPCPSCTSIIDGVDGAARHLVNTVAFAVVAKVPIERFRAWGEERGWRFAPLFSSANNTFKRDYLAEDGNEMQRPVASVFAKRDGVIRHFWSSELIAAPMEEGQHPRHVDYMWPFWKLLDGTPDGRTVSEPKLEY
jgi:predicted dithiol-disulfide oxidoreductase (DUF899 family)